MNNTPAAQIGDWGTPVRFTVRDQNGTVRNVATATAIAFAFRRPDGTTFTRVGVFTSGGTDGRVQYVLAHGELDQSGEWWVQAKVTGSDFEWSTRPASFSVKSNL